MKHPLISQFEDQQLTPNVPDFAPGDTLAVHVRIDGDKVDGDGKAAKGKTAQSAKAKKGGAAQPRRRAQIFTGVVIARKGGGLHSSFVVRKIAHGVGVERTFLLHSNLIEKIEVMRKGDVRKAKLYYLRGLSAKKARIKEKFVSNKPAAQPKAGA